MPVDDGGKLTIGFDVGSAALKVVVTDLSGNLLEQSYTRTHGRPIETALTVLGDVLTRRGHEAFDLIAGTGTAGRLICELLEVTFVNEVICQAAAAARYTPEANSVIEMGGQDSKLILLERQGQRSQNAFSFRHHEPAIRIDESLHSRPDRAVIAADDYQVAV